jgi:hypothetical protein
MISSFQLTRSTELRLTHRTTRKGKHGKEQNDVRLLKALSTYFDFQILFSVFAFFRVVRAFRGSNSSIPWDFTLYTMIRSISAFG